MAREAHIVPPSPPEGDAQPRYVPPTLKHLHEPGSYQVCFGEREEKSRGPRMQKWAPLSLCLVLSVLKFGKVGCAAEP